MNKDSLFYERLKGMIQQSGKSFNCIERELGYPRNALHNYKYNTAPTGKRLIELSQYFNVTPEFLLGDTEEELQDSPQNLFNHLNEEQKLELLKIVQKWGYDRIARQQDIKNIIN
ncbi:helix-turn-helix transcriptional regulator [Lactococcus lactis]|uniref:helix-turn-helix transcriptional regulator n=1 Tax=Lactococcus lactis TaxID=1358 RepID=UPI001914250C|nr:helix-turn-helix transcriptional regulator [Lactococcus lactis]WDA67257.1 XRE family transcriptional regulator [Lactococcus lactis]